MKNRSIASSALQISAVVFITKILGVFKQIIIAAVCGATAETDSYFTVTGIMMAVCTVFFSSLSITLLSVHTNCLIRDGREESNRLINSALRVFLPVSFVIALLFFCFSGFFARILASSYESEQLETMSRFIRIVSVMPVLTCFHTILNVVLETDKSFLPGKAQSFFINLFLCIAAPLLYPGFGMPALVGVFVLAGVLQCIIVAKCAGNKFWLQPGVRHETEAVRKVLALSLPLLAGNAIYEINDIVDKKIAIGLGHGNVSYLSYGASINEIVTTLVVASVSTVLFAHYSTWAAEGDKKKVGEYLRKSMEYLVVLILPLMALCLMRGDIMVAILYKRGNFDSAAVRLTGSVVAGYAAGFLFQALRANLTRVYYAFQDTKTPMITGAVSISINIILSILLSRRFGAGGIAAATSIAMLAASLFLLPGIYRMIPGFSLRSGMGEYGKAILAVFLGVAADKVSGALCPAGTFIGFMLSAAILVGVYLCAAYLLKINAVRDATSRTVSALHKICPRVFRKGRK